MSQPNIKDLQATVAALEAKLAGKKTVSVAVGEETGTVQIRGLRRFPIALYPSEWDRVLSDEIVAKVRAACKVAAPIASAHRASK